MGVFIKRTKCVWAFLLVVIWTEIRCDDEDYNVLHRDGSYEFGYKTPDSYHYADANRQNVVRGEFGARDPTTGGVDSTVYTAGPRGFRPRGKNIVRKYDLNQNGPRPVGSRDDPFYDPLEDPSYSFSFRTRTYTRQENANRIGDVNGKYTYLDDVGERHNVEFIAGKKTGFHVKTPFPDSNPRAYGPLYYNGRGKPIPRGRTSIQRGLDGSYRFVSAGPDQRRTEISDPSGHVRGSYTYLDDKGVQHSVHYIAGPEIGYRVLKNVKGPHLPTIFPFGYPDILPPNFYDSYKDDIFDTNNKPFIPSTSAGGDTKKPNNKPDFTVGDSNGGSDTKPGFPQSNYNDEDGDFSGDLFGGKPPSSAQKPNDDGQNSYHDDGQYRPTGDDGQYRPNPPGFSDLSKPAISTGGNSIDNDYGPFDSNKVNDGRPTIQITDQNSNCERCKGTIVTNVGDKIFTVPPGVSVRAHVQSIDLLPLASQVPSPTEQFNAEMNRKTEQLNSASVSVDNRFDKNDNTTETTTVNTPEYVTATTTTKTATETATTTEKVDTTTSIPVTTTTKTTTTTRRNRDDDDDLDIF